MKFKEILLGRMNLMFKKEEEFSLNLGGNPTTVYLLTLLNTDEVWSFKGTNFESDGIVDYFPDL